VAQGEAPVITNDTWRGSGLLMLTRRGWCNRAPNSAERGAWHPFVVRDHWSTVVGAVPI